MTVSTLQHPPPETLPDGDREPPAPPTVAPPLPGEIDPIVRIVRSQLDHLLNAGEGYHEAEIDGVVNFLTAWAQELPRGSEEVMASIQEFLAG